MKRPNLFGRGADEDLWIEPDYGQYVEITQCLRQIAIEEFGEQHVRDLEYFPGIAIVIENLWANVVWCNQYPTDFILFSGEGHADLISFASGFDEIRAALRKLVALYRKVRN